MLYLWIVYISPNVFIHSKNVYLHLKHNIFLYDIVIYICNSISITFIWLQAKLFVGQTKNYYKNECYPDPKRIVTYNFTKRGILLLSIFWMVQKHMDYSWGFILHPFYCISVEILAVLTNYRQNYVCYQKICTC